MIKLKSLISEIGYNSDADKKISALIFRAEKKHKLEWDKTYPIQQFATIIGAAVPQIKQAERDHDSIVDGLGIEIKGNKVYINYDPHYHR